MITEIFKGLSDYAARAVQAAGDDSISRSEAARCASAFADGTSCAAMPTGWSAASAARCARRPARRMRSMWKRPRTPTPSAIRPASAIAKTYEINMLRCIFCGYCEDACPTDAIVLTDVYELSADNRRDLIYTKDMLILPPPRRQAGHAAAGERRLISARDFARWSGE